MNRRKDTYFKNSGCQFDDCVLQRGLNFENLRCTVKEIVVYYHKKLTKSDKNIPNCKCPMNCRVKTYVLNN